MRFTLASVLLAVAQAQAATWNSQDCEFVELFFQECAKGPQQTGHFGEQCLGTASESEASGLMKFEQRHPASGTSTKFASRSATRRSPPTKPPGNSAIVAALSGSNDELGNPN
ncbi:hypothetical protein [Bradyrhizobium sp. BWC-3-1]|uniref:hypothetical protein n=1 Tax=Bradyrhizobium sp. BWC-3-1 TaxID=3080012 RepID=UPI00293E54D9|nr:hypothetical protein [Bradyrhizobium sp. BWC-3-1]WOH56022.1 hypothetical protein RX329_27580 [Bradyrhizobium sp. BWC-3-1]